MMLASGRPQMNAVGFGGDLLEAPDLVVEVRRLLKIADPELDAAELR